MVKVIDVVGSSCGLDGVTRVGESSRRSLDQC